MEDSDKSLVRVTLSPFFFSRATNQMATERIAVLMLARTGPTLPATIDIL